MPWFLRINLHVLLRNLSNKLTLRIRLFNRVRRPLVLYVCLIDKMSFVTIDLLRILNVNSTHFFSVVKQIYHKMFVRTFYHLFIFEMLVNNSANINKT
jgi:hypothetical protein